MFLDDVVRNAETKTGPFIPHLGGEDLISGEMKLELIEFLAVSSP